MSTDREELEMAAKAAGYWSDEFNCPADLPHPVWNPRTNFIDAIRLAEKLEMDVVMSVYGVVVRGGKLFGPGAGNFSARFDPMPGEKKLKGWVEATCIAVTSVVAEMGRAMP